MNLTPGAPVPDSIRMLFQDTQNQAAFNSTSLSATVNGSPVNLTILASDVAPCASNSSIYS